MDRYGTTRALFEEYKSYKYDSAFAYATRMGELAARLESPDSRVEAGCATVFCLISAGLYKEAFDMLDGLSVEGASPKGLLEYYRMQVKLNYSARGYSQTEPYWSQYTRTAEAYTRKIMETVPPDSPLWYRYNANLLMEETRFDEGIEAYRQLLSDKTLDLHSRAIYASSLGWMLHCQGREDEAVEALCESAICDLQSSTKETTALRMLAEYLSLQGEVDRPSRYVHESFDDANFYNARLRKLEVGAVLPIVEKNHYDTLQRERNGLVLSVILAILVILAPSQPCGSSAGRTAACTRPGRPSGSATPSWRPRMRSWKRPMPSWRRPMRSSPNTSATPSTSMPSSSTRWRSSTRPWTG